MTTDHATEPLAGPGRPEQQRRSLAFLLRPSWLGGIAAAIVFAVACWMLLAPWQFGRNTERSTQSAQITAAIGAAPRPVDDLLSVTRPPAGGSIWQPVSATGTFRADQQVYVRLRQDANGQPASEVVVPLQLADGTVVLVDRGYVSLAEVNSGVPLAPLPTGPVTVTGRVQADQPDPLARGAIHAGGRTEVTGISAAMIPGLTGPVRQGFIQLIDGSPAVLTPIGVPQLDDGPFLSYALQWCAFGAMGLLAIGYFVVREFRDPRPPEEADTEEDNAEEDNAEETAEVGAGHPPELHQPAHRPAVGPVPVAVGRLAAARSADGAAPPRRRRSSRGFDRSQLYDSE